MSSYTKCCVPGCEDRTSTRHRFPNPTKDAARFNLWIEIIGNPKLVEVDPMRIYRNVRVCHQHFTIKDKSSNMYLVRTAIPSQRLPSVQVDGTSTSQPYGTEEPLNAEAGISISQRHGTEETLNAEARTSTSQFRVQELLSVEDEPSTSRGIGEVQRSVTPVNTHLGE